MNLAQGFMLALVLVATAMMGVCLKHEGEERLHWWAYLLMVVVFLWDYKLVGG